MSGFEGVSGRGRKIGRAGRRKIACENLESRVLLAGSPFPPPALLGTYDAGWDLATNKSIGEHASYDGKVFGPGVHPNYTLDGSAFTGAIPLLSISWGEVVSGMSLTMSDVSVSALAGRHSTGLLQATASRQSLDTLNLHAYDNQGRETRRWTLTGVRVTSLAISDAAGDQTAPFNSFSLHFDSITITTIVYDRSGNPLPPRSVSYSRKTGAAVDADFGGVTFAPGAQPQQLLDLGTGQMAVHSVSWGETAPHSTKEDPPPPAAQDFSFISETGPATLGLLSAVFTGDRKDQVTLATRDDAGRIVAQWNLAGVVVTSYQSTDSDGATPVESFSLHADRVQLVRYTYNSSGMLTGTFGAGFDYPNNLVDLSLPSTLAGNSYSLSSQPSIVLQVDDSSLLIPVDSFAFGNEQSGLATAATPEAFTIVVPQAAYSTGLLRETSRPNPHAKMAIISRNAAGQEVMRWVLREVELASYATSDFADDGQGPLDVFTLAFKTVHAEYTPYDKGTPQTPVVADWDPHENIISGTPLSGNTYTPGTEPGLALDVGGILIPVDATNESFQSGADIPAGTLIGAPDPVLIPPVISVPQGRWSPSIFASVVAGTIYPTVSLVSRDSSGRVTGRWNMTDVQFTADLTSSAAGGGTSESVNLSCRSIERTVEEYNPLDGTTKVYAAGWDFVQKAATLPANSTLNGNTYSAGTEPQYALSSSQSTGLIPVVSFSWGDSQGDPITGPMFNQVSLVLPAGRYDTGILAKIAKGGHIDSVVLVRRDALGRPIYRYTFEAARFTSISAQYSPGQEVFDSVLLDYQTFKVERIDYTSMGDALPPVKVDWDIGDHSGTGTDLGGNIYAPGTEPESVLDFGTAQLAVNSYSWSESHDPDVANPSLQDFTFTTFTGQSSLGLFSSVALGTTYPQLVLTTRDADGHIVTQWKLTDVSLASWQIDASTGAGDPLESVAMHYSSIKLIYNAYAPAAVVEAVSPGLRNTAVPSLVIRFSEPVTGLDLLDLQLSRDGGANLLTAQQTLVSSDSGRTWTLGNLSAITSAADGTYSLTLSTALAANIFGLLTTEPIAQATGTQWTLDRAAPAVSIKSFDYLSSPNRLRVTFNEDVTSIAKGDLKVIGVGSNAPVPPAIVGFSYDPTTHTGVWTFASNLLDGNYQASLDAGSLTDLAGNSIAKATIDFFALAGDANHDRNVDFNDLVALAQNYNTSGKTFDKGDFNYDGNVDFNDLVILAQRYNTTLAPPGGAEPAPVVGASFSADLARAMATPAPVAIVHAPAGKRKVKEKAVFSSRPIAPVRKAAPPIARRRQPNNPGGAA